jgi:hypothetical protein
MGGCFALASRISISISISISIDSSYPPDDDPNEDWRENQEMDWTDSWRLERLQIIIIIWAFLGFHLPNLNLVILVLVQ